MGGEGGSSLLPWSVAERVGETVGKEGEMGILACQQGPLLRKLSGGGKLGEGGPRLLPRSLAARVGETGGREGRRGILACEQGPLLKKLSRGELGGGGRGL